MSKNCQSCGREFSKPYNASVATWATRKYCSRKCIPATKHGEAWKTPEYAIWQAMIQRCTNSNSKNWHKYGGRGITVSPEWLEYKTFIAEMGRRPSPKHSLDRADNDKGYSASNCRWTTIDVQANNTRTNRVLEHDGRRQTISQWAIETKLKPNTIVTRLRYGWPVHRVLSEPVNERFRTMRAKP